MKRDAVTSMVDTLARNARTASEEMAAADVAQINRALLRMAAMLKSEGPALRRENEKDLRAARAAGLSAAMIDRLTLSDKTMRLMIDGLRVVARLPSPVGTRYDARVRPNGLRIYKMKVPIGVVAIVYESRPNVTVDAAAICLKSQNAVILRGGSEAFHSNLALARLFGRALAQAGLPAAAVQFVATTDRTAVDLLLGKDGEIDLVIPRGGESLIRRVVEKSRIPVIKHYKGVCHVFVSRHADMRKAVPIAVNAKVQRPGVCNAMETLLLDKRLPREKKRAIITALLAENVRLFGDASTRSLSSEIGKATEDDWYAEYLDLRLAVREVNGVEEAVRHINTYGSRHTDAIVTESAKEAALFRDRVDSSSVMINASTRFSDGGEYGMGCEIGISTDKLHARGPMGVEDLTTYKWIVEGEGQVRQ
jgi:glutamate-5-semialdehyde dehydrogenase